MAASRKTFTFIFTATLAAVFLIITGLIGTHHRRTSRWMPRHGDAAHGQTE